jgi:hypothetical protein
MASLIDIHSGEIAFYGIPKIDRLLELNQLALWNRVPFGKFNRASAFPVACCGVSERTL